MIVDAQRMLTDWLSQHPVYSLALATAWLDPAADEYDSDDELIRAYYVCRKCFPDVYTLLNQRLAENHSREALENFVFQAINEKIYPPMPRLEHVLFGLPILPQGIGWYQEVVYETYPELLPVLRLFGVVMGAQTTFDEAWEIARTMYDSLDANDYRDLRHLLEWLFSFSGNTLVDYCDLEIDENAMEYMDWTPDNIQFNREMHEEADEFIALARQAVNRLDDDPVLLKAMKRNIRILRKKIACKKVEANVRPNLARLCKWPPVPQNHAGHSADGDD